MVKKIIKEEMVSIPEVKEIMEELFEKMDKIESIQPDPFQEATYEYVHNFSKMSADVARNVIKIIGKEKYILIGGVLRNNVNIVVILFLLNHQK